MQAQPAKGLDHAFAVAARSASTGYKTPLFSQVPQVNFPGTELARGLADIRRIF